MPIIAVMDLVSAMVGMQAGSTLSQVQMAVARKIMDNQEMQGAAALKLLEAAATQVDASAQTAVAAASGLGRQVDVYA
jgi:hypothetical protein